MYVMEVNQKDWDECWDEYAERPSFVLNTAQDRVCEDTPFYLIRGWDPRSTLKAILPLVNTKFLIGNRGGGDIAFNDSISGPELWLTTV